MEPIDDGIEVKKEELIGVVETYILEIQKDNVPDSDNVSWFNRMKRIVFITLGDHDHRVDTGKGYGLFHLFHGKSRDEFMKWGLKSAKGFADFVLETMDNPDMNPDKFGIQISGGYPIYRVRINDELKYIKVIISQKGGIINALKSNKGSEYFKMFDPNKAHVYQFKGY